MSRPLRIRSLRHPCTEKRRDSGRCIRFRRNPTAGTRHFRLYFTLPRLTTWSFRIFNTFSSVNVNRRRLNGFFVVGSSSTKCVSAITFGTKESHFGRRVQSANATPPGNGCIQSGSVIQRHIDHDHCFINGGRFLNSFESRQT